MKKWLYWAIMAMLFAGPWLFSQESEINFLQVKKPSSAKQGKYTLLINLNQVEAIISDYQLEGLTGYVEFADAKDLVQARLGKIKNNTITWLHKITENQFLSVKFHRSYYKEISEKLETKAMHPGYQIIISDTDTQVILKGYEITFCELPDLRIDMTYPVKISSGQALQDDLSITVTNKGALVAENIALELVLSRDKQVPLKKAPAGDGFQDDGLLENGRITVPVLQPGEKKIIPLTQPVVIPDDTPPGKYNLCALIDPGNAIREFSETNNIFMGFVIVSVREPRRIILNLEETELVFEPASYGLKIQSHGLVLSDGKDWRKCRMKAYLYQIKHVGWKDIHWEINTLDGAVWEIRNAPFCKTGGKAKELGIQTVVSGGSKFTLPARFILKLPGTTITYEPETKKMHALASGSQIIYVPFWKVCKVGPHLYQFINTIWADHFIEVNTREKKVYRVSDGQFCKAGGTLDPLSIKVVVEDQ